MARRNLGKASKASRSNHLSRRVARALASGVVLLASCKPSGPAPLSADEQVLVNTYVRIAVLDVYRGDEPDSARVALDALAAQPDSAAVRRALAQLEQSPERWEAVWDTISKQLRDLEAQPSPAVALRVLDGRPQGPQPPKPEPAPEPAPQLPAQPRVAPDDSLSAGARARNP